MKTLPHEYDPRIQQSRITWHNDPDFERFMIHLLEHTKPDVIVETGTHMGWTAAWFAEHVPPMTRISTVEVDKDYARLSRENLASYPNVHVHEGSSVDWLPVLMKRSDPLGPAPLVLYWLDAHWWPPIPLQEECRLIARQPRYLVVIDDFFVSDPDFSGDTFVSSFEDKVGKKNDVDYIASLLGRTYWRPNYPAKEGFKGYALFTRRVDYEPPHTMRQDSP